MGYHQLKKRQLFALLLSKSVLAFTYCIATSTKSLWSLDSVTYKLSKLKSVINFKNSSFPT